MDDWIKAYEKEQEENAKLERMLEDRLNKSGFMVSHQDHTYIALFVNAGCLSNYNIKNTSKSCPQIVT